MHTVSAAVEVKARHENDLLSMEGGISIVGHQEHQGCY